MLSDVDVGVTQTCSDIDALEEVGRSVAAQLGDVVDVHVHPYEGFDEPSRHVFALYTDGAQLDLMLIPAATWRPGHLVGEEVVLIDKDDAVSQPLARTPEELAERAAGIAAESAHAGWWYLGDVVKYVRRGSNFEAVERLAVARDHMLRLAAVGAHAAFPQYGLISLLDFAPDRVPARLAETYPVPQEPSTIVRAALALADLIDDATAAAEAVTERTLARPLAVDVRRRMATLADRQIEQPARRPS